METELTAQEHQKFDALTDEEIVAEIHAHNNNSAKRYLFVKYKRMVMGKTKGYYLAGGEKDDLFQEGMIGLFKAIRDYDPAHKASFKVFADLCVSRQIITAVKYSTRQKQIPLNSYVSIDKPVYAEDSEQTLLDVLTSIDMVSPEEALVDEEAYKNMEADMYKLLSSLEWQVFRGYLDGKSYQQIGVELHRSNKSIDNALTRVKRKIVGYKQEMGSKLDSRVLHRGLIALSLKARQKK